VLTGLAGGNTVGAIFNAALSNVLGVFATPIWVAWLMEKGGQSQPMGQVLRDIVLLLLLPLGVGQLLRLGVAAWADRWKKALGNACSGLILFLVFAAFCNSVQQGLWKAHPPGLFVGTALCVGALLLLAITLVGGLARLGKLDRPDRIAATFCAPQKTIASGIPLAKAIFGTHPGLGLILLPILLYHPLQLLVCGVMADRFARAKPPA
jgi:sodium/bile acid cotransporter 7